MCCWSDHGQAGLRDILSWSDNRLFTPPAVSRTKAFCHGDKWTEIGMEQSAQWPWTDRAPSHRELPPEESILCCPAALGIRH